MTPARQPMIPFPPGLKERYSDPAAAYARLVELYEANTRHIRDRFQAFAAGEEPIERIRACYPFAQLATHKLTRVDTRRSYGFVPGPGLYRSSITRPDLFNRYLNEQLELLALNHGVPIEIGISGIPIPLHFAFPDGVHVEGELDPARLDTLGDWFDLPDLAVIDDATVNGTFNEGRSDEPQPLSLFTAARVDYSLHRLRHYTATGPAEFQNFVLFTNYQFYVDEFVRIATEMMSETDDPEQKARRSQYSAFVEPGGRTTPNANLMPGAEPRGQRVARLPQMPAYHLQRPDGSGITLVNIGVGPSNAKTITDHIAVLRPHAWVMLGHCAGLRNTQQLGDYVLAHAYVRDDHVLDEELPLWVPLPALAEVQVALEAAVSQVTGLSGYALKSIMRTGTVATIDNRNWELLNQSGIVTRFSQSRAVALDMESATIAANGFRFRVPYGTLLCVSDKPLHGQLKLPGMANRFYRERIDQHLEIGIRACELMRERGLIQLHSRKLRSFQEAAFR